MENENGSEEFEKAMKDDIDEMNKVFDEGVVMVEDDDSTSKEEEEKEEETSEEEKESETETEEKEESEKESEETEEKSEEEETTEEKEKEEEDSEVVSLRQRVADLEAEKAEHEKGKETETETEEETKEEELKFEDQDFITEDEFEDLTNNREKFNEFLNRFHQKTVLDTRKIVGEGFLRKIPEVVIAVTSQQKAMDDTRNKFYSENKDLKPFQKVVAAVFEEVAAENPGKKYDELLDDVAKETRNRLDLHKKATDKNDKDENKETEKGKGPKLPRKKGSSGRSTEPPETDPLLDDIDEMNKTIRR